MKLLIYSDLHLEFGYDFEIPADAEGDVLVLAGDIVNLQANYSDLYKIFRQWTKPIIYIPGNHEYYTRRPISEENEVMKVALRRGGYDHVRFLLDEPCTIGGVNFFGGTMWTDFWGGNAMAMSNAQHSMTDYRLIVTPEGRKLRPEDTIKWHKDFKQKLQAWFSGYRPGPHVVITHTAPVEAGDTKYHNSPLQAAFVARDVRPFIEEYYPALWIYGHTHECDDQRIGGTRVVSNQQGYRRADGSPEDPKFDPKGMGIEV